MKRTIFLILVLPILTGCSSLFPTIQPASTEITETATQTGTKVELTPTITITVTQADSEQRICLTVHSLTVRTGPGANYDKAGYLLKGDCVILTGRDAKTTWVKIDRGWVYAYYFEGMDLTQLPVVNAMGETATVAPPPTDDIPATTITP